MSSAEYEEMLERAVRENDALRRENEKLKALLRKNVEEMGSRLQTSREDEMLFRMMRNSEPVGEGVRKVVQFGG